MQWNSTKTKTQRLFLLHNQNNKAEDISTQINENK